MNLSVVYGTMPQEALMSATERGVDRAKGLTALIGPINRDDELIVDL